MSIQRTRQGAQAKAWRTRYLQKVTETIPASQVHPQIRAVQTLDQSIVLRIVKEVSEGGIRETA